MSSSRVLEALGFEGRSGRFEFFLGLNKVTTSTIRNIIEGRSQEKGWPTQAHSLTKKGLKREFDGENFEIWYDRTFSSLSSNFYGH